MSKSGRFATVDEYINSLPENTRLVLEKIRETVRKAAPEAVESISYQIPTFKLNGKKLVYFGGWKDHVGFYSISRGDRAFRKQIAPFETEKGALKFPIDKPFPYDLLKKLVKFRIEEIQNTNKQLTNSPRSKSGKLR